MRGVLVLALWLVCDLAVGQITIAARPCRTITGLETPIVAGDSVTDFGTTEIKILPGAEIKVESAYKFHIVRARKLVVVNGQSFVSAELAETRKVDEKTWMLAGDGKFQIQVIGSDPGLDEAWTEIVLGPTPQPDPGPNPPGPLPPGPTPAPVPNDYGVGAVAVSTAPADPQLAKTMAGWYRAAGPRLWGNPTFATVDQVLRDLNQRFASKQCRDQATCEQWGRWKQSVDAALIQSQRTRGTFRREDWNNVWTEIATALEAVK